jgi:hypothetical protein
VQNVVGLGQCAAAMQGKQLLEVQSDFRKTDVDEPGARCLAAVEETESVGSRWDSQHGDHKVRHGDSLEHDASP